MADKNMGASVLRHGDKVVLLILEKTERGNRVPVCRVEYELAEAVQLASLILQKAAG